MARVFVSVLVLALVAAAAQAGEKQHIAGALKLAGHLAKDGHPGAAAKVVVNVAKEEVHKVADAVRNKVAAVKDVVQHEKQHVAGALHAAGALAKNGHPGAAGKVLAHVGKDELHKVSAALHSHNKRSVVEKIVQAKKVEAIVNSLPDNKPTLGEKVGKVLAVKKTLKKSHQKKATLGEKVGKVLAAKKAANVLSNVHSLGKRNVLEKIHNVVEATHGQQHPQQHPNLLNKVHAVVEATKAHQFPGQHQPQQRPNILNKVHAVVQATKDHQRHRQHKRPTLAEKVHGFVQAHNPAHQPQQRPNILNKVHAVVEATKAHQFPGQHQPQQRPNILNKVHAVVEATKARNIIAHLPRH